MPHPHRHAKTEYGGNRRHPPAFGKLVKHQAAGKRHHAEGEIFGASRYGATFFPIFDNRAEEAVLVQPAVETRRSARPAGGGENHKRRGGQNRQKDAENAQEQCDSTKKPE